jgi:hypothetical protein
MSKLIRDSVQDFLPPPGRSLDPRVSIPPDVYNFVQNQIESQQRQAQAQMNRTNRLGNINSAPKAAPVKRPININFPSILFTIPLR